MAVSRKRILILSRSFFPTISPRSFRATELAKELARQGNMVKVITSFIDGVDYEGLAKHIGVQFKNLGGEKIKVLTLHGSKPIMIINRLINRSLLMLFEFPTIQLMPLVIKALKEEAGYDLIISIAVPYPIHWGVAWARTPKHKIAKTWVADCGDPYMGDQIDTFKKLFYFKFVEKWAFKKADFITINVPDGHKSYYSEFHYKIKYIPQGLKLDDVEVCCDEISNYPIKFAYAGGFIPIKRDPRPFIEYLLSQKIDFRFYIFTRKKEMVNSYAEKFPSKIIVKDYIPRLELLKFLSTVDFLINFDNNTEATFPSKLLDYTIANRPILNVKSSLDKPAISAFLARDYSQAYVIDDIQQYDIAKVTERFLELI